MNEQQLTQVLDGVDEALVFAPGESKQLTPKVEVPVTPARSLIIESATRLANDMVSVYRDRVEVAQRKLEVIENLTGRLVAEAVKAAEEVDSMNARDRAIGEAFFRTLEEHGIEVGGEI